MFVRVYFHILFLATLFSGPNAQSALSGHPSAVELYTNNPICRENNCINPLFPGLNDLPRLEQIVWQCTTHDVVTSYLEFCKEVVAYDPALPSPNSTAEEVRKLVKRQDDAASTMFVYHLNGMGYEAWEHKEPHKSSDPCIQSIWKMVCYTYFPKVEAGCQAGQGTPYRRPCRNACDSYLKYCSVECCDESAQCVFEHSVQISEGVSMVQTGYYDEDGPSALCTGSGSLGLRAPFLLLLAIFGIHIAAGEGASVVPQVRPREAISRVASGMNYLLVGVLLVCALFLHGCDMEVPKHKVGRWRQKPDYLVEFEFVPPGQPSSAAQLNSCMMKGVSEAIECSGHGYCKEWNSDTKVENPVSFCVCDPEWADPECRTRRKSQVTVFLCSLFGGFLGIDYFYLGYPLWGMFKLVTLGGCGFWWLVDIIRMGSGPVYAYQFRVNHNLPHWVFVLVVITLFSMIGFFVAIESYLTHRKKKREDVMKLHESEESNDMNLRRPDELEGARYRFGYGSKSFEGRHEFSGYGATLPIPHPNADASYAVPPPQGHPGRFAGPFGPAGYPGMGF